MKKHTETTAREHGIVENTQTSPDPCLSPTTSPLPDPRLQQQIGIALKPNARLEEALQRVALSVKAVHDFGACNDGASVWTEKKCRKP